MSRLAIETFLSVFSYDKIALVIYVSVILEIYLQRGK